MAGRLLHIDTLDGRFYAMKLRRRNAACAVCGDQPTIALDSLVNYEQFCSTAATDAVDCALHQGG